MDVSFFNPFLQIDEYRFQDLCRDLLGKQQEEGVVTCRRYEERGAIQRGVDVLANCSDGRSVDVGQCKRYQTFSPKQIRDASDEFFEHLDFWKSLNVRRFILMVACRLSKENHHTEIQAQSSRFLEHGIRYEVWDHDTLRLKLAPYQDLVRFHFPSPKESWVEVICGSQPRPYSAGETTTGHELTLDLFSSQLEKYSSIFSREQSERLEQIRELNRKGHLREAYEQISRMQQEESWGLLPKPLRSKILKVAASLTLHKDTDTDKARELVEKAVALDPDSDSSNVRALLRYYERGPEDALVEVQNPVNVESFDVKIALLLELNKIDEALRLISQPPGDVEPDTETKRLHALVLLCTGDVHAARVEISKAEEEKPDWESVKTVRSMVDYYGSLSPAAFPKYPLRGPEPAMWQYIKRDDESRSRLREAEKHFAEVLARGEKNSEQLALFETWRLACLANDADRQKEAVLYCRELLAKDPTHPYALSWAITRNFDVDSRASELALEKSLGGESDGSDELRIDRLLVLLGVYLKNGKAAAARKLLARKEKALTKLGARSLYSFWLAQLLVSEGDFDGAINVSRHESDITVRRKIKTMALRARYVRKGDWKPFLRHLEKSFRKTQSGEYLMELCQLRAERRHWDSVADHADQLVGLVITADAVRLAAGASWHSGRTPQCLKLLEEHKGAFPGNDLPADLRRLRVRCQSQLGALSKAVSDAEELVEDDDSPENILTLMDAQLSKADLNGLIINARKILRRNDFDVAHTLRAARFAHLEDSELAKRLWRRVKDETLDDPFLLGEALNLGYTLGLDKELRPLFRRMQEYAEAGVKPFGQRSVKDLIPQMKKGAKRAGTVQEFYAGGQIPIHFFSKESGITLADLLHGLPEKTRAMTDLRRQPMIFARYGGRPVKAEQTNITAQASRLHMDVTALLLATDLDILDMVERVYRPLRVSPSLPKALLAQREKLRSGQLSVINQQRAVLAVFERNDVRPITPGSDGRESLNEQVARKLGAFRSEVLSTALAESGYVVEHLPLTSHDGRMERFALSDPYAAHVVNCRAILESLHEGGKITKPNYEQSLRELGTEGAYKPDLVLPLGSKLFFLGHTLSLLAGANLLELALKNFDAFVAPDYIEGIRGEVNTHERHLNLADWLKIVTDRVSEGFDSGAYEGVGAQLAQRSPQPDPELAENYDFATIGDLLQQVFQEGDLVWIDDRYTNSFSGMSGARIVTVTDILSALLDSGELSEAEYYAKLLLLRGGNIRNIPVGSEEILFHLKQARVVDGQLVETRELSALRRYIAACLYDGRVLQKPNTPEGTSNVWGETGFVFETTGGVLDAVVSLWAGDGDVEEVKVRSEWLLSNLYTGRFGTRHLMPNNDAQGDGLYFMGQDVGEAFAKGAGIFASDRNEEGEQSRRAQYFNWLNERVVSRRIKANPQVVAAAARTLSSLFRIHASQEFESPAVEVQMRIHMQSMFMDLPEAIRDELKTDPEIMSWIGIQVVNSVQVGGNLFPATEFWAAAAKAINGEESQISPNESDEVFRLVRGQPREAGSLAVDVIATDGTQAGTLDTPLLGVLMGTFAERLEWLRGNRFWFDCRQDLFESEVEEIALLDDPGARLDRANTWAHQSAAVYYRDLKRNVRGAHSITRADLTKLSAEGLLRHHRIEPSGGSRAGSADGLSEASKALLAEEGIGTALDRLVRLPVKIQNFVVDELAALSPSDRNRLFSEAAQRWRSPLAKLHFVDLVLRTDTADQSAMDLARGVLKGLFDNEAGRADFRLFKAILVAVNDEFGYWSEMSQWDPGIRLAMVWSHACKLFDIVHSVFGSPEGLTEWFLDSDYHFSPEVLARDQAYWNDCLHPRRLGRTQFLTHGAANLLGSNDRGALVELNAPELVGQETFMEGESRFPKRDLLDDPALSSNRLNSFLGGDRFEALSGLLDEGNLQILASDNLKQVAGNTINVLSQDPADPKQWALLRAVTGDLPLYDDLRGEFTALVSNMHFENLLRADSGAAMNALIVVSGQLSILPETDRIRCEEWLIKMVVAVNEQRREVERRQEQETPEDFGDQVVGFFETALTISIVLGKPRESSKKFSNLALRMIEVLPEFSQYIDSAMLKLVRELPVSQLHGLWRVVLANRSALP